MIKTRLTIEGMMCHNCEAHMNEAIKMNFAVQSVSSDHEKNLTEVLSEEELSELKLKAVTAETGFSLKAMEQEEIEGFD